jgi:hypothetical protein
MVWLELQWQKSQTRGKMAEQGHSSDEEVEEAPGMARSLGMRMQKKLLGMTVKSKSVAKAFVDDNTGAARGWCWAVSQFVVCSLVRPESPVLHLLKEREKKKICASNTDVLPGELLDNLYEVAKMYHKDSKPAKKFMKASSLFLSLIIACVVYL